MKLSYTQPELDEILKQTASRIGWDFSRMRTTRQPVPWDYATVVKQYSDPTKGILDIGTGGGERFLQLVPHFRHGVGVDIDPAMVKTASKNAQSFKNVDFVVSDEHLTPIHNQFDVIIDRHAPFNLAAISKHLKKTGYFITQQVGERNMLNIKRVLKQTTNKPPITSASLEKAGLTVTEFREYDVEYVVHDIGSLVFWLNALDMLHADLKGDVALASAHTLNTILAGNVDERGFVTNEHRYLAVARM